MSSQPHDTANRELVFPVISPDAFSGEEREQLIAMAQQGGVAGVIEQKQGLVGNREIRRSTLCWIRPEDCSWAAQKIRSIAEAANELFKYDITDFVLEPFQLTYYDASDSGFYNWHLDIGPEHMSRKLSITIPLNDPAEYDGGDLELNYGAPGVQEQKAGDAIIFPSYVLHRVTPVTRGRRYSLVTWIHGPNWR